ncbi:Na+/H+ antiporter [Lampropedia aestuarii]|uniref:Na+/H+ antiporter n=1 Tax=Lampropedia aestuarii TaxID=2562762 RepID=UPI002469BCA9|nr:Na+/H+ antiporter [Lampropedia aestuarii]MDH5856316.1 Na+/H+ antiporter [Lampropedia aestuarii]
MHTVEIVLLVLMLGAVSGLLARYVKFIPLPLLQIALGMALAWPQAGLHIAFDPDLFLLLFIPPLLFADGWRIPKREFFALYKPILRLALGLVFFTVIGLGYFIHWLIPAIPLPVAFALAAVLSPTDAVAVSAIARNLGMPTQALHILEGESLLNDASGLVALKFAVAAAMTGAFSWMEAGQSFVLIAVGGVIVGLAIGWLFGYVRKVVTRLVGDTAATQMVLLLLLLPFAAYLLGERLGVSGILAAVSAGIAVNFTDLDRGRFISERMQSNDAWQMVEATFNGAIFLLLGIQLPTLIREAMGRSDYSWWQLLAIILAITVVAMVLRAVWLHVAVQGPLRKSFRNQGVSQKSSYLLTTLGTVAGIRGAVTLAGALSIPLLLPSGQPFPARDLVIMLAAGVIIATLLIGSVGLPLILRRLPASKEHATDREERRARVAACHAALVSLQEQDQVQGQKEETSGEQAMWVAVMGRVAQDYRDRLGALDDTSDPDLAQLRDRMQHVRSVELGMELRLIGLQAEREEFYHLRRKHLINDDSLRLLVDELDLAEVALIRRRKAAKLNRQQAEEALAIARKEEQKHEAAEKERAAQEALAQAKNAVDAATSTAAVAATANSASDAATEDSTVEPAVKQAMDSATETNSNHSTSSAHSTQPDKPAAH